MNWYKTKTNRDNICGSREGGKQIVVVLWPSIDTGVSWWSECVCRQHTRLLNSLDTGHGTAVLAALCTQTTVHQTPFKPISATTNDFYARLRKHFWTINDVFLFMVAFRLKQIESDCCRCWLLSQQLRSTSHVVSDKAARRKWRIPPTWVWSCDHWTPTMVTTHHWQGRYCCPVSNQTEHQTLADNWPHALFRNSANCHPELAWKGENLMRLHFCDCNTKTV